MSAAQDGIFPPSPTSESLMSVDRLFEAHLPVADLDASVAFYRDLVGLELAHVVAARQAAFFWVGPRGNGMLGLWAAGSSPHKTTMHIAFATTLERIIAAPRALLSAASPRSTSMGSPHTSRWCWLGCRRRQFTFAIRTATCWNTSRCLPRKRASRLASWPGISGRVDRSCRRAALR